MDTSGGAEDAAPATQQEVLAPPAGGPRQAEEVPAALAPAIAIPPSQLAHAASAAASTAIPRPSQAPEGLPLQASPAIAAALAAGLSADDEPENVTIASDDAYGEAEPPRSCS